MAQAHKLLIDEISKLPLEKVGKALSFIRYLEHEPETELVIDPIEETQLRELLASGDTVEASEVLSKIMELPND